MYLIDTFVVVLQTDNLIDRKEVFCVQHDKFNESSNDDSLSVRRYRYDDNNSWPSLQSYHYFVYIWDCLDLGSSKFLSSCFIIYG